MLKSALLVMFCLVSVGPLAPGHTAIPFRRLHICALSPNPVVRKQFETPRNESGGASKEFPDPDSRLLKISLS